MAVTLARERGIETLQTTPQSFHEIIVDVGLLMWCDVSYDDVYLSVRKRSEVPTRIPCVVDCSDAGMDEPEIRCVAFAVRANGHLRWFGVTHALQDPAELRGVSRYVPVSSVIDNLRRMAA